MVIPRGSVGRAVIVKVSITFENEASIPSISNAEQIAICAYSLSGGSVLFLRCKLASGNC